MRQLIRENTALRRLYHRMQILRAKGQSDETQIIERWWPALDPPLTRIQRQKLNKTVIASPNSMVVSQRD